MIEIVTIDTRRWVTAATWRQMGRVALVVDPQRDIDRVLALAAGRGVAITDVLETHIHNDYITGGLTLAGQSGCGVPRERC